MTIKNKYFWNRKKLLPTPSMQIINVSQKWVHPSHFCRYLSISLHGTTLTKWHFDTMNSSLCAVYITELIYIPLKITQSIAIKSETPANKSEYTPKKTTPLNVQLVTESSNMAPHGKELSEDLKRCIVAQHEDSQGYKKIANTLKLSCNTVAKIIQHFKRVGSTQNRPQVGRPKKLSARAEHHIQMLFLKDRRRSAVSIAAEIEEVGISLLSCTLHQIGVHGCLSHCVAAQFSGCWQSSCSLGYLHVVQQYIF